MRSQSGEAFRLGPVPPLQHPDDSGLQVVVTHPTRNTAEVLERENMPFQKGFLGLGAERDKERLARVRQPHHEHPELDHRSGDRGVELAEVDLRLRASEMRLRDRHLSLLQTEFGPPTGHLARHRHLRQRRLMLGDKALPDPTRGMPLLARCRCTVLPIASLYLEQPREFLMVDE